MRTKIELDTLIRSTAQHGFQPMGILFYDAKTKLCGIAPLAAVPDAWTEEIGRKLGGIQWVEVEPK